MSRQINFYAAPADTERIHQWLLSEFPGLTLASQSQGPREHMEPTDASKPGAFWHYPISLLIPAWAKPLLKIQELGPRYPGEFYLGGQDNPVIEYRPAQWDEVDKVATATRFYWSYDGVLPKEALRQIDKLFRWVQRNTTTGGGMTFRFFPGAASTARFLRQGPKSPLLPNPLLQAA